MVCVYTNWNGPEFGFLKNLAKKKHGGIYNKSPLFVGFSIIFPSKSKWSRVSKMVTDKIRDGIQPISTCSLTCSNSQDLFWLIMSSDQIPKRLGLSLVLHEVWLHSVKNISILRHLAEVHQTSRE